MSGDRPPVVPPPAPAHHPPPSEFAGIERQLGRIATALERVVQELATRR